MQRNTAKSWIWERPDWPNLRWDTSALSSQLAEARRAQAELMTSASLLDASLDLSNQLEVLTQEGIATSAIEGDIFDPDTLRSSLARQLGVQTSRASARSRKVDDLVEMLLDATRHLDRSLDLARLCAWQAALFPGGRSGLKEIRVGALRGPQPMRIVSGAIGRERVHYEAPPRASLGREVRRFLAWFNSPPPGLDGILRSGIAHAWFEVLHPFEDGNGRVGRALIDRALAQDEGRSIRLYSVSRQLMAERDAYYAALENLSRGGLDITPWLSWYVAQVNTAMSDSRRTVGHVMTKARFWLRHAADDLNVRQRKALNRMLDAGPDGFEGGMNNRKYANLTGCSAATAQRDLAQLVILGCLSMEGAGRSVRYQLRW